MELTLKVDCKCAVIARLDENGVLSCRITGHAEYAKGAMTSVDMEPPVEVLEQIKAGMQKALDYAKDKMALPIGDAIHVSRTVAKTFNEI